MKLLKERINYPSTNNGMFFFSYIWLQFYYVYHIKKHIIQNITNISFFYSVILSKLNSNILYLILFTDSNLNIIYSQVRIIKIFVKNLQIFPDPSDLNLAGSINQTPIFTDETSVLLIACIDG